MSNTKNTFCLDKVYYLKCENISRSSENSGRLAIDRMTVEFQRKCFSFSVEVRSPNTFFSSNQKYCFFGVFFT